MQSSYLNGPVEAWLVILVLDQCLMRRSQWRIDQFVVVGKNGITMSSCLTNIRAISIGKVRRWNRRDAR